MKSRILLAVIACFVTPFLMGASEVTSNQQLNELVGGNIADCNVEDGKKFDYTNCTGGTACDGQWRHKVKVPGFGSLIHKYEMLDHCEEENSACDPHKSFEKTGSDEDGTCIAPVAIPAF